uniref:ULP_PROTEASE domain-containing protein n=1 Tax=Angiostrongylus cantonensis TaxID=6313 RepID=A0A158P6J5_ANGCA
MPPKPAAKGAKKAAKSQKASRTGNKKKKDRRKKSYSVYIYRVLKQKRGTLLAILLGEILDKKRKMTRKQRRPKVDEESKCLKKKRENNESIGSLVLMGKQGNSSSLVRDRQIINDVQLLHGNQELRVLTCLRDYFAIVQPLSVDESSASDADSAAISGSELLLRWKIVLSLNSWPEVPPITLITEEVITDNKSSSNACVLEHFLVVAVPLGVFDDDRPYQSVISHSRRLPSSNFKERTDGFDSEANTIYLCVEVKKISIPVHWFPIIALQLNNIEMATVSLSIVVGNLRTTDSKPAKTNWYKFKRFLSYSTCLFCRFKEESGVNYHETSGLETLANIRKNTTQTPYYTLAIVMVYGSVYWDEYLTCRDDADYGNTTLVCDPSHRLANITTSKLTDMLKTLQWRIGCECVDGCRRANGRDEFIGLLHVTNTKAVSSFDRDYLRINTDDLKSEMEKEYADAKLGNATCDNGLLLVYLKDAQKGQNYDADNTLALQFLLNNYKDVVANPVQRAESWLMFVYKLNKQPIIGLIAAILIVLCVTGVLCSMFMAKFCCCCAKRNKEVYHVNTLPSYKTIEPLYVVTPPGLV